ncbi:MAG TPA: hypothetical protein VKR43_14815 [Bryobacteraceae bacterium]|nr:hypothetical protein [Bryobacteraceae bacterium]
MADDRPNHTLSATHTDRFSVAASVSIRLENSFGEINVEGWDSPEVEVTVTKSVEQRTGEKANAAQQRLDSVQVGVKHSEGEAIVSTVYPPQGGLSHLFGRRGDVMITYRIHAPRASKLIVEHNRGGLNITGISADIRGTVDRGQITLTLPDGRYALDAKCRVGKVYSDFEGHDQRQHLIGEEFDHQAGEPNLYLRAAFGDIMILKTNHSLRTD